MQRDKKTRAKKQLIIFDLDGTLYELHGGSYKKSPLCKAVLRGAVKFIAARMSISQARAVRTLDKIIERYGEQISIGLEKEFKLDRYDYFNTVWDIPAHGIVKNTENSRKILLGLKKNFQCALVSDAPHVWIMNVLKELNITDIFKDKIFSGEGNQRKEFNNAFVNVARTLKTSTHNCIVVGDQEKTDIIPPRALGMYTIFVHRTKRSRVADISIKSIAELQMALTQIIPHE